MAFTSGTATNYHTLLTALKTYLESQGWTTLAVTTGTALGDVSELHIKFPGVNSFTGVLNIRTVANVGNGWYGWQSSISKSYSPSVTWGSQQGESPSVFTNMWDQSLGYWFYVNDRRVVMSLKVSSVYASAFWGMFLPFATPDEYNYPYYISSNYSALGDFAPLTTRTNFFIASPSANTAYYYSRNEVWKMVWNRQEGINFNYNRDQYARLWPYGNIASSLTSFDDTNDSASWFKNSRPLKSGEVILVPCHLYSHDEKIMLGVLDGVHALPAFGKGTEQQLTQGSRTFRLFQDLNRTTDISYMALEEL